MLSPDESSENNVRSSLDNEVMYSKYERLLRLFHKVEIAFLVFAALQVLFFYLLAGPWYYLGLYDYVYYQLEGWDFSLTAISVTIRLILVIQIAITYVILKRLHHVISTETHSIKRIHGLLIVQLVLLNILPGFVALGQSIVLLVFFLYLRKLHRST